MLLNHPKSVELNRHKPLYDGVYVI